VLRPVGWAAMAAAARLKAGGLIVNEHTLTRDELRVHVETLGRWFEFIHADQLPERLARPRERPFCLLTFDDGNRSSADVIAPELERLGVPACFFVVTGFVGGDAPLWFSRYAELQRKLKTLPRALSPRVIKQLPYDLLLERLERACRRHGVSVAPSDGQAASMTWDQVRGLHKRGFTIGAHGVTHAIMTRETKEAAFDNIARSMERVSAEIGAPCASFAFPNGNYTAELALHAVRCGARTVMTTEPLWVDRRSPLWRLPRVQLFERQDRATMELKIALSATGSLLRSGDGTGMVYRDVNRLALREER
jgi:peptidoglycan/xylan/chitin deacetylase (PgdA/CDA1 family)